MKIIILHKTSNRDELKSVLGKETEEVDKEEMEGMHSLLE
jgi:hypothetical protein